MLRFIVRPVEMHGCASLQWQLPREGEQAMNINTKVMKLKKVHLLSLCEDRSRQKTIPCSH